MKKLLKFINTLLFIITIGLTVLVSVGILVDDNSPIVGLSIILLFTGIILFLLFLWRKKLNQSKNPNTNISPNVQVERPQNVIPEQPSKNETVEPVKSDESISDGPKISESTKEESVSEDYRENNYFNVTWIIGRIIHLEGCSNDFILGFLPRWNICIMVNSETLYNWIHSKNNISKCNGER